MKNILQEQTEIHKQDISGILRWTYRALPVCYVAILIIRLFTSGWYTVISMVIGLILTAFANYLLNKGRVEASLSIFILSLTLILGYLTTIHQGIHDIGIVVFPIILLISSLMFKIWQQIVAFVLVLLIVIWLAMGENWGYFKPNTVGSATFAEFAIIVVVLIVSGLLCFKIAGNLKKVLSQRDEEVKRTQTKIEHLKQSLDKKISLTNAVHLQVADSITIIRELLGHQREQSLSKLPDQLVAIELVHLELYRLQLEKKLDLENYLDALFERQSHLFEGVVKGDVQDVMINVDQALSIGILLTELALNKRLKAKLSLAQQDHEIKISLHQLADMPEISMLGDVMIRQLVANLEKSEDKMEFTFKNASHE